MKILIRLFIANELFGFLRVGFFLYYGGWSYGLNIMHKLIGV